MDKIARFITAADYVDNPERWACWALGKTDFRPVCASKGVIMDRQTHPPGMSKGCRSICLEHAKEAGY